MTQYSVIYIRGVQYIRSDINGAPYPTKYPRNPNTTQYPNGENRTRPDSEYLTRTRPETNWVTKFPGPQPEFYPMNAPEITVSQSLWVRHDYETTMQSH